MIKYENCKVRFLARWANVQWLFGATHRTTSNSASHLLSRVLIKLPYPSENIIPVAQLSIRQNQ